MTTTKIIGQDLHIWDYKVKQAGYGRQHLYFEFEEIDGKWFYIKDVFPDVHEGLGILLDEDAVDVTRDKKGRFCKLYFTDLNGNGHYEKCYRTTIEALQDIFAGFEIEIEDNEEEDEE